MSVPNYQSILRMTASMPVSTKPLCCWLRAVPYCFEEEPLLRAPSARAPLCRRLAATAEIPTNRNMPGKGRIAGNRGRLSFCVIQTSVAADEACRDFSEGRGRRCGHLSRTKCAATTDHSRTLRRACCVPVLFYHHHQPI